MLMRVPVFKNKGSYDHLSRRAIIQARHSKPGDFSENENVMKRPLRLTPRLSATLRGVRRFIWGYVWP